MKDFTIPETEPAPQRRPDPVRPRRVMLPDSLGVPRSIQSVEKETGQRSGSLLTPKRPSKTGGWEWR